MPRSRRCRTLPEDGAPDGDTEDDAVELRRVGEPVTGGDAREATEIGRFEMERAARLSGSRFGYLVGDTALLALALYRFAIDHVRARGFTPVLPPVLVREEAMVGTGFFPTERSNIYALEADDLYLTGTSEVALAGLHMGEILEADDLPLRYCGFSTCFRREAGAAGKDTRGHVPPPPVQQGRDVRLHAAASESHAEHERMVALEEELLQALGLPYRAVDVAAGDLGAPPVRKIDLEAWFPSQGRYREVTSCSNTTDFQARQTRDPLALAERARAAAHAERHRRHRPRPCSRSSRTSRARCPTCSEKYGAPSRIGG